MYLQFEERQTESNKIHGNHNQLKFRSTVCGFKLVLRVIGAIRTVRDVLIGFPCEVGATQGWVGATQSEGVVEPRP
jgi:hypothetical protein